MTDYVLTLLDVAGIQDYIFGSNNLAQNIGASELVSQATREWVFEELSRLGLTHNGRPIQGTPEWDITDDSLAAKKLAAEVIYAGGGNAVLLFENELTRRQFVEQLTRRVLREAIGLQLAVKSEPIRWEANDLRDRLADLRASVGRRDTVPRASVPLLGLGVTAACDFTGQPVYRSHREPDGSVALIARHVHCKLAAQSAGEQRLKRALPGYEFVRDFDQFGTPGESSYLAVVHADGNRMRERVQAVTGRDNAEYIINLRKFSRSTQSAVRAALRTTARKLAASYDQSTGKFAGEIDATGIVDSDADLPALPFRPIVFGGDDVTFVTDGRLGLTLTATYLTALLTQDERLADGRPLYSRAGIAIVKSHYPFARAYLLAEALEREAKQMVVNADDVAMDWHVSTSGAVRDLGDIRIREYVARDSRSLLIRPVRVSPGASGELRTWDTFARLTAEFKWGLDWRGRRNKVKSLRDALRTGEPAVRQFLINYDIEHLPELAGWNDLKQTGWEKGWCGYFDAIEATDFFVDLERNTK